MLTVCTWWWGDKFALEDVAKLAAGVRRNLRRPYRFACIHDKGFPDFPADVHCSWPIPDEPLTKFPGCYARLRMFDPAWQAMYPGNVGIYGSSASDQIVCIDLDTVITGLLDDLFSRNEPFVIMQGGNASNPCKFNGALMMLRAGAYPEVWRDFSVDAASKVPFDSFPDDQGWIWDRLPNAAGWKCGIDSGVFVFRKPGWPSFDRKMKRGGDDLPKGARLVTFSGGRSPKKFDRHLDWVKKNWAV